MIIKLLILFAVLGILPLCIGFIWEKYADNIAGLYLYGLMTMLAAHQALAIPMCFIKARLSLLIRWYLILCIVLAAAGLIRLVLSRVKSRRETGKASQGKKLLPRFTMLLGAVVLCMLLQAGYVTQMQHVDADDAYYLATAVTAVEKDGLYTRNPNTGKVMHELGYVRYMLASWPVFIAVLSGTSGMHATVIAHMVLPAVVLFWCYLVFFLLAGWIYPEDLHRRDLFMLLIAVLFTFSGFSIYSSMLFPLIRGWQGKAVLAGMGFPLLIYQSLKAAEKTRWSMDWTLLLITAAGISAFSTIADIFGCVMIGCISGLSAIRGRKVSPLLCGAAACGVPAALCGIYLLRMKGLI